MISNEPSTANRLLWSVYLEGTQKYGWMDLVYEIRVISMTIAIYQWIPNTSEKS